jgi:hypothetical protein
MSPRNYFAAVPAEWEERQRAFNPTTRAVYVQLLLGMRRQTGIVRLSLRVLAERAGLSRGQVDRGLRSLSSGRVISYTPGTNQHSDSVIEVLLRHRAVPSTRQRAVSPAGHQQDSASHQQDSASHQQDSSRTAHRHLPAETSDRGLEVYADEEEGATLPPPLSSGRSAGSPQAKRNGAFCPACRGSRVCNDGDGDGDYACGACKDSDYA